eukprot:scaffold6417_cov87-Cyclotella_meneghiniana.AAC.5
MPALNSPAPITFVNMFDLKTRCKDFAANRDLAKGKEVNPDMLVFYTWVEKNKEAAFLKCARCAYWPLKDVTKVEKSLKARRGSVGINVESNAMNLKGCQSTA